MLSSVCGLSLVPRFGGPGGEHSCSPVFVIVAR